MLEAVKLEGLGPWFPPWSVANLRALSAFRVVGAILAMTCVKTAPSMRRLLYMV